MMRVLFLDIDGIVNHASYGEDLYHDKFAAKSVPIVKDNLEALKSLFVACPDLKVVWSSSWGICDDETWQSWKNPRLWLEAQDFMQGRVIGITPRKFSSEHFHEIKWWLDEKGAKVDAYVILEDDYFPAKWFGLERHLVQVESSKGLTPDDVAKAIEILTRKDHMIGTKEDVEFGTQVARRLLLSARDCKVELNKRYRCEFQTTEDLAFPKFEEDRNSPSYTSIAAVSITDKTTGAVCNGRICLTNHNDLAKHGKFSCMLFFDGEQASSVNVTYIRFADIEGNYT